MASHQAPDFSAYVRDDRMIVQVLLAGGEWLSVSEPGAPALAVEIAKDVVAAGQPVDFVRITLAVPRW